MNTDRTNTHSDAFDPNTVGEMHSGQVRMAYRLAAQYRGELLYLHTRGRGSGWLSWDGTWWTRDDPGAPTRAVLEVLRRALADSPDDKKLHSDVNKCESAAGVARVLALAAALETFAITATELAIAGSELAHAALAACAQRVLDAYPAHRDQALKRETLSAIIAGVDPEQVEAAMLRTAQMTGPLTHESRLIITSAKYEAQEDWPERPYYP